LIRPSAVSTVLLYLGILALQRCHPKALEKSDALCYTVIQEQARLVDSLTEQTTNSAAEKKENVDGDSFVPICDA
jgi:hypothetical protein